MTEINAIVSEADNEIVESELFKVEQSPNPREELKVASLEVAAVKSVQEVAESEFVTAAEAAQMSKDRIGHETIHF